MPQRQAFVPLDVELAQVATTWVGSAGDVALFAGTSLQWPFTAEQMLATAAEQSRRPRVLLVDGVAVAMGSVQPFPGAVRIGWMLVDPRRRGEGWGRRMFSHVLELALADPHAELVSLAVVEHNLAARALYSSLGFSYTGERRVTSVDGSEWVSLDMEYRPR